MKGINKLIFLVIILFIFNCKYNYIIDYVNVDADMFYSDYDFNKDNLKIHKISDVLILPYFSHVDYDTFYLYLKFFSESNNNFSEILINNIILKNKSNILKEIDKEYSFSNFELQHNNENNLYYCPGQAFL